MRRFTKALSILLSALMVLSLIPTLPVKASGSMPAASWQDDGVPDTSWYDTQTTDGKGGSDNPYVITTAEELAGLAKLVNNDTKFTGKYIRLDQDIDLGGRNWVSIGSNDKYFIGNFDGNNHIIKNLTQYVSSDNNAGLFGNIDINWGAYKPDAFSVKNLGIVDVNISGMVRYGGALASQINIDGNETKAACENCFSTGTIHSDFWMGTLGGLFGYINLSNASGTTMTINNCYSTCDISLTSNEHAECDRYAGGLIGKIEHFGSTNLTLVINNCYSASRLATALSTDSSHMGGFIGVANTTQYADATNQIIINNCIFDVQAAGISYGFDKTGSSYEGVQGKTTAQMTGTGTLPSTWDTSVWQTGADLYPQLKTFALASDPTVVSSSLAGAIPIFLFENKTNPEFSDTYANVRYDFRVPVMNGVTWTTDSSDIITIDESGNAVLKKSSSDTYVTVTAQLGNNVKKDFVILCKAGADSGDTTPPVITLGDITPADFSASIIAASNESAEIYILVKAASEAAPGAAQIVSDNKAVKGNGTGFTTTVSSLDHSTNYIAYAVGVDPNGNVSDVSSKPFTTLMDKTPPSGIGYSGYIYICDNEASFSADYNEAGTIKYVVLKSGSKEPTKEQIVSEQDGDGKAAVFHGEIQYTPQSSNEIKFNVSSFLDDVYNIFLFCEDEHGNSSDILKLSFTTKDDDIKTFMVEDQVGDSLIDIKTNTVVFHMLAGADVSKLKPSITVSENATVFPKSGDVKDFTKPQNYTISASYGVNQITQRIWKVTCISDKTLNSIEISKPANKLTYAVGEHLDITGMEVVGTYSDNSKQIQKITEQNVSGFDSTVPVENQTLTVTVGGKTATYVVTIEKASISVPVTGVSITPDSLTLTTGGTPGILTSTVAPSDAANKKVTWSSSDPSVATVDNGKVTPVAAGTAVITVATEDGNKTAACEVVVASEPVLVIVPVTGVSITPDSITLTAGGTPGILTSTVAPSDAANKKVTWSSSDPSVATVDNGKVTPVAAGTAVITVATEDGNKTAACEVVVAASEPVPVIVPVTGVSITPDSLTLTAGGTPGILTSTVAPSDAANKKVTWSSSDPSVATVDNGKVTPVAAGTAVITVATEDGNKTAACEVVVAPSSVPIPKPDPDPVVPTPTPTPTPSPVSGDGITTTETIADEKTGTTTQIIKTIKADSKGNTVEEVISVVKDKNGRITEKDNTVNKQNRETGEIISIQTETQFKEDGTILTTSTSVSVTASTKKVQTTDEKTEIMIAVPYEDIVEAAETAAKDKPLEVGIKLPGNSIQEQIKSKQTASVEIEVTIPGEISANDKINLNNISLDKNIIETAKTEGKDVEISVKDEKGKELYRWSFSGKQLKASEKKAADINLALSVVPVKNLVNDNEAIKDVVNKQQNGSQGLVINFNHKGELTAAADVKIYVGNQEGIKPGSTVNMYYFNSTTGNLESLSDSEYVVDKDGYITVKISHCSSYVLIPKAEKKLTNVPAVEYVKAPILEYKAGDIVGFDLHAPNYNGRVQYRVILWDGNKKEARDLWTTGDRYYNNWMPNGSTVFNLHWKIDEPGVYRITVYVKRAEIKNNSTALTKYNCDSYMESQPFVVKEKTTAYDKNGQTYGSAEQNKAEVYNRDISISGKNVTFNNAELKGNLSITGDNAVIKSVKVSGKIIIDPGKDGSCTLDNVIARDIQILSGGCNSIHIKNTKAETMNIDSKNTVRIEVDGDTEIVSVQANGYVIFDKKNGKFNTIIITKNENGESVVEFRGDIQDKIVVERAASIRTGQASRIANLVVNTKSSTDKVKLEGNYDRVEANSITKLELKGNTKLKSLVANKDTEVTMDKTAVITDVERNNNVVIIKEGGSKENIEPKDNSGSYKPPTILVTKITVTSDGNIDTVIKGKTLQMNAAAAPANAGNKTIVWTASQGTGKATIDKSGFLTAVEAGSVTVKAANPDSGVSGTKGIAIIDDPALIVEYTNAANAVAIKAVLSQNKLGLTLTDYAGLDDTGKLEVAAKLFSVKATLTTKALIQAAVTAAISESKLALIERTLVKEYTNAASVEAVKILLDSNGLKLDLTSYAKLEAGVKSIVAVALYNKRASLTSKILIQDAVISAMPVFITKISAATPNGAYKEEAGINIAVDFSANVTVTGTPFIHLDMPGKVKDAKYLSGSGTSTLTFVFTVEPGDNTSDLEYMGIDALDLNLGGIKAVDNTKDVNLTLPAPKSSNSLSGTSDIVIDTTDPSFITISTPNEIPANGSVILSAEGGPLDGASWNDILSEIKANTGMGKSWITGVQGSSLSIIPNGDSAALTNNSNVNAVIEADFIIPKTKIYDKARNYADGDIVINSHIMSKIIGINSSSADRYYKAEDTISINVTFDEPVDVTGSPALCLETGVNDRLANYTSGSGTNTLTFNYTVQTGDTSNDLDYTAKDALILNGGMIKVKGSDMDANLTLPLPGTERSLEYIKDIRIDAIEPASIAVSSQNIIPGGKEITLTAVDGILDYFSWEKIFDLIRSNTSSGENWITGIPSGGLMITLNCNGINSTLSSPIDAIINRDFIIPKNLVVDEAGNTAANDIRIDSCNSVTDIAIADKYVVFEVNNATLDLYVAYAKTAGQLKNALKSVDDSPQTYVVTDSTGALKEDNSIILIGDVLTVTSESGLSNKLFPIRVAPEPVTTIQLKEDAVNALNITIDNTKGYGSYMVIRLLNMTVGQVKSGLKSTSVEAPQTYEIIDSFGKVMTDDQNVCTGVQLIVTAYDGVAKASYAISIDLAIIKVEDISVNEGDSGTVDAVFTIRRIGPTSSPLTIGYQFDYYDGLGKDSPYNASRNVDYTCGESHDVTFNANESTKTFIVKICGDTEKEENEKFHLILIDNCYEAEIRITATCTIIDNDGDK